MVIRFKTSVIPYGIDGYINTTGKKDETVLQKIKEIEEKISELEKRISTIFAMKRELGKANFSKDGKYISGGIPQEFYREMKQKKQEVHILEIEKSLLKTRGHSYFESSGKE